MTDYLAELPIPSAFVPDGLRELLQPVGNDAALRVEVSCMTEDDLYGPRREVVHMLMAIVPDDGETATPVLHSDQGLVYSLTPVLREKGSERDFLPSVNGYDYIVASWGSGSFYTYHLAEKVWMALGLTPRCFGNEQQRLVYDDLKLPEFNVVEGEISAQYFIEASRQIRWRMSNEYLRRYLWLRGGRGVRQFYYSAILQDTQELRNWINGRRTIDLGSQESWFHGDIRESDDGFLLQLWATVDAVSCELCPEQTAEGLHWPDVGTAVTREYFRDIKNDAIIYLDDKFLERYEQNSFYKTCPLKMHGFWNCSPSYLGQWSFTRCERVGRNLIRVSLRDLYSGVPDREILHAHKHALSANIVAQHDKSEEHFVSKVDRLLFQLLNLGDNLSKLGSTLGIDTNTEELTGFSREEINNNGWMNYPQLKKLAQVSPITMTQQQFLARCKSIHEIWQKLPNGILKKTLQAAGIPRAPIANRASLKLLQSLLNILQRLDSNQEDVEAFRSDQEPERWDERNPEIAMLFVANDLRIADAHDVADYHQKLADQGFDIASLNQGYGRALDFVMDGVINSFEAINNPLARILART